jgi:hypothetical protein
VRLLVEVHEEIACLLGGPFPGGMEGDAKDPDVPVRVLDYRQNLGLSGIEQASREEVARQGSPWPGSAGNVTRSARSAAGLTSCGARIRECGCYLRIFVAARGMSSGDLVLVREAAKDLLSTDPVLG